MPTHAEIIEGAKNAKSIFLIGDISYYNGYGEEPDSAYLYLKPAMGEIVMLDLLELFLALENKRVVLSIHIKEEDNAGD